MINQYIKSEVSSFALSTDGMGAQNLKMGK